MKAWRKEAAKINAQRKAAAQVGRGTAPTAREQLRQARDIEAGQKRLRWPTLGSFLLAGLFIRAGISEAVTADGAQP